MPSDLIERSDGKLITAEDWAGVYVPAHPAEPSALMPWVGAGLYVLGIFVCFAIVALGAGMICALAGEVGMLISGGIG